MSPDPVPPSGFDPLDMPCKVDHTTATPRYVLIAVWLMDIFEFSATP